MPSIATILMVIMFWAGVQSASAALVFYNQSYSSHAGNWSTNGTLNTVGFAAGSGGNGTTGFVQFVRSSSNAAFAIDNIRNGSGFKPTDVSLYFRCPASSDQEFGMFWGNASSLNASSQAMWKVRCAAGGVNLRFTGNTTFLLDSPIPINRWLHLHVGMNWSNSNATVQYWNGSTEKLVAGANFSSLNPMSGVWMATDLDTSADIDELQVWNVTTLGIAPNVSLQSPVNGSVRANLTQELNFTVNDADSTLSTLTCSYRVADSAGATAIGTTILSGCANTTFTLAQNGLFQVFATATDNTEATNTTNSTFTVNVSQEQLPEQPKASGGAGTTPKEAGVAYIDYGRPSYAFSVRFTPYLNSHLLPIKNTGNASVFNARLSVEGELKQYVTPQFCRIGGGCEQFVSLRAGETGMLNLTVSFPQDFELAEGVLRISNGKTFDLPIEADRPAFWSVYSYLARTTGMSPMLAFALVYMAIFAITGLVATVVLR